MKRYFQTYTEALAFIRNAGLTVKPFKSQVWVYPSRETVWTVEA